LDCEAACPRLAPGDIARLQAIRDPATQRLRRAAHIAQRLILERLYGPPIRRVELHRDSRGRPHIPAGFTGSVSLAHTEGLALIAASHTPRIGVDLEAQRDIFMTPARRNIIETAAARLTRQALPRHPDASFLQAWTRLEALAKAEGRGIGRVLTAIGALGQRGTPHPACQSAAAEIAASLDLSVHDLEAGPSLYAALAGGSIPPALNRVTGDLSALLPPA
jgi:4'-phosphopantetheinyl transferase